MKNVKNKHDTSFSSKGRSEVKQWQQLCEGEVFFGWVRFIIEHIWSDPVRMMMH